MAYTLTQINPTRWRFHTQVGSSQINLDLDSSSPNVGALHGQIINLVTTDRAKADRFGQLLEWNNNFAFVAFCMENSLVIPPDEVIPE